MLFPTKTKTTTNPDMISKEMVSSFMATKKLDNRVLVLVLMEFRVVTHTRTSRDSNLCVIGGSGSFTPKLE